MDFGLVHHIFQRSVDFSFSPLLQRALNRSPDLPLTRKPHDGQMSFLPVYLLKLKCHWSFSLQSFHCRGIFPLKRNLFYCSRSPIYHSFSFIRHISHIYSLSFSGTIVKFMVFIKNCSIHVVGGKKPWPRELAFVGLVRNVQQSL